jgi:hypothetical protein
VSNHPTIHLLPPSFLEVKSILRNEQDLANNKKSELQYQWDLAIAIAANLEIAAILAITAILAIADTLAIAATLAKK